MNRGRAVITSLMLAFLVVCGFGFASFAAETLIARDAMWKYHRGTVEATDPIDAWRSVEFDDTSWASDQAPFGYGSASHEGASCNTVLTDMQGNYTTLYLRRSFTVTNAAAVEELVLSVDYDDGFIVWINGERVLDANAPDIPTYDSLATGQHEADVGYVDYALPSPGSYLATGENMLALQGFNATSGSSDFKLDVSLEAVKRVKDTKFSHDRGFYGSPFTCTITTATSGATIKYTLDGSDPRTSGSATTVSASSAAVPIDPDSGTGRLINGGKAPCVVLRAYASKGGHEPTNVDAQTYLFAHKVPYQPDLMSSENWIPGANPHNQTITKDPDQRRSTLMDTEFRVAPYFGQLTNSLHTLPTLSITANYGDIFGDSYGVWHNSLYYEQPEWERAASVEWIEPDGEGFQANVAMHCSGGGANRDVNHKTQISLTFEFKSAYGPPRLDYPLFPRAKSDSINGFRIRAQASDAWGSGDEVQMVRENFARQTQRELDWALAPDERWAHVYVNGMYWGYYLVIERLGVDFLTRNLGGEKADYDVIGSKRWYRCVPTPTGTYRVKSGDNVAWEAVRAAADAGNYAQVKSYMNVGQYIDYHIIEEWGANGDWAPPFRTDPGNNYRAARKSRNRSTGDLQWNFFVWDYDYGIRDLSRPVDDDFVSYGTWSLHLKLKGLTDYKAVFSDRLFKMAVEPDGVLHPDQATARYSAAAAELEPHVIAHLARWGYQQSGETSLAGKLTTWQTRRDGIVSGWCAQRTGHLVVDYKNAGVYPLIEPPEYAQHGGAISSGFQLTMTNPNGATGTMFYKLDGTDPRAAGGAKASGATQYSGSVALSRTTHVKARVYKSNATWSAVHAHTFNYTAHHPLLRITEIHYNPLGGGEFEFVELQNVSGSTTIGLSEMTFGKGLDYTFAPGAELGPGQFAVLVRNAEAFTNRYPTVQGSTDVPIFGVYRGKLDNGGERLELVDAGGVTVASVRYNDRTPWPEEADGNGFSLVYTGTDDDQDHPEKWRASNLIGGSPGYDEGDPYRVVINEALTHTDLPQVDTIELYNDGDAAVDIGGWWLSDSDDDFFKWQIPSHVLGAGGYKTYDESDFGAAFRLSSHGDEVYLTKWDARSNLLYYAEARFGGAENGRAFGRYVKSDGDSDFVAQSETNTLGAANAYPLVGPVVISELMYHPPDGGDEFVELMNVSDSAVGLYDPTTPTNSWRLDGAVEYTFPTGVTLQAGEIALVVSTNASSFRAKYGVPTQIQIFDTYQGALDNAGESVKLWRPDTPDTNGLPWILVDRVKYNDNSPWPESADGAGPTLERIAPALYGNDPINWSASAQSTGTPGAVNSGVLVSKTAGWRYHDRGIDLGTGWRASGYDASGWEDGNAPLGYPDTNPAIDTEVDYGGDPGNKHITTYFRKAFVVADPGKVNSLTLRVCYDDGYVAYLNGQEVARGGIAVGPVVYSTTAESGNGSNGAYEEENLDAHIGKLVAGANVLAVEIHQVSASSSDIFMDLELVHTVTQQPVVALPTFSPPDGTEFTGSVNVTISTATAGATVFYTTDGSAPDTGSSNNGTASVQVGLTDTTTLKSRAYKDDTHAESAIAVADYTEILPTVATPTISPHGGDFYSSVSVTISTVTSGATVFYTTDGSSPSDTHYAGFGLNSVNFSLTDSATVKANAYKQDYNASGIDTAVFTDMTPTVRFVAGSSSGSESVTNVTIAVELSNTSTQTVRVDYQTSGGTASVGSDYVSSSGTLTFTAGQTSKNMVLAVADDEEDENDETVILQLSNAQNADLGTSTHTYTITDNDQLFVAYNDLCWAPGDPTFNITTYTTNQSGLLTDYNTGNPTPVTLAVTDGGPAYQFQGVPPLPGTDAHEVFDGIVGLSGLVSYAATDLVLTFSGMDASLRYELVFFGNRGRADYTDRSAIVTLSGVEPGFENASTPGTTIGTTTLTNDTTTVVNGANTTNGYVARWTQIDPGPDGQMTVTIGDSDSKPYSSAIMLRAQRPLALQTLVAGQSSWKYHDTGANLGTAWRAGPGGYDDSSWSSGPAGLGYPGTKDGVVTVVSYGSDPQDKYITTYFRQSFTLAGDPAEITGLTLGARFDDGFVAYLNGQEIARSNMPAGAVTYTTLANAHNVSQGVYLPFDVLAYKSALNQGANVLAVEIHQIGVTSSDILMDAELIAELPAEPAMTVVIAKGAAWRYRKGTAEASAPAPDWRAIDFDDGGWTTGAAPLGYGSGTYGTVLDMQNNYSSVFLRKAFDIANPGVVNKLALDVDYDDGFILWLNAEEIARVGVLGTPGAFKAYDETCDGDVAGASIVWATSFERGALPLLRTNNVLAAQLFNHALSDADACLDVELSVATASLSTLEDDDQDGLPNDWEVEQYGTAAAYAWYQDPDLDGMSVIAEYVAGTGPTNGASNLALALEQAGGDVVISFPTIQASGTGYGGKERHYALEQRAGLGPHAVWAPVPGYEDVVGLGQTVEYTNTTPAGVEDFRARVWLE